MCLQTAAYSDEWARPDGRNAAWWWWLAIMLLCAVWPDGLCADASASGDGRTLYDFYCYQCHGYNGDGRTLAASYLEPPPRSFRDADPRVLDRAAMIEAVTNGKPDTAMVGFVDVISLAGVAAVVDFIRAEMMPGSRERRRYHSPENGWKDHNRYAAAYPFATGEIRLDTPWESLPPSARQGRVLYMRACVSCHDNPGGGSGGGELIWDLRPLSFPRDHYSHRSVDLITGASPYARHDQRPAATGLSREQQHGRMLFEANCAFCHAMDGTGRNWIGRFMEPHPRNLTDGRFAHLDMAALLRTVREGLPGTSMPAWREVLSDREILDILAYVTGVLAGSTSLAENEDSDARSSIDRPVWRRSQD